MADESRDNSTAAVSRFRETSIAFDDLIVQVGRAVARAQEEMDLSLVAFQREVARAVREGRLRRIDVNPQNAYTIPETRLSLKIGLSLNYPEEGGPPALTAVPLNATTTNENDIDVQATTQVDLRFVSVPQGRDPPGVSPSALLPNEVEPLVSGALWLAPLLSTLAADVTRVSFVEGERLWLYTRLSGQEPELLVLVDDRRKAIAGVAQLPTPPTESELVPVGPPTVTHVSPDEGRAGRVLTAYGDNLLTLAGQTTLRLDGRPVPIVRHTMNELSFKVPPWATSGDVEVATPQGTGSLAGAYLPLPTIERFEPAQGHFDALAQKGTWVAVFGSNFRGGCSIRFAGGAVARNIEISSPTRMRFELPDKAQTGPVTLVYEGREDVHSEPFAVLPRVHRLWPRQAPVGTEVELEGTSLSSVSEIAVGEAVVDRESFALHTPTLIRFRVPAGATDGRLRLRQRAGGELVSETATRDLFYVVPRITGFSPRIVLPGQLMTVHGEGLDPDPQMMTLLLDGEGGTSEAPVLSVAGDRRTLTTRVPSDAVTGYVVLIRKRIFSGVSPADTSRASDNKLTVLSRTGALSDVLLEERFDADLAAWQTNDATWSIEQGLLQCAGTGRLEHRLSEPRRTLAVHTEVLRAGAFGLSLVRSGGRTRLQLWIVFSDTGSVLSWTQLDTRGRQTLLDSTPVSQLPGGNHLLTLLVSPDDADPAAPGLDLAVQLDQEMIHTFRWAAPDVGTIGLMSDSPGQRWDNVVVLKEDVLRLPEPPAYRFSTVPPPPVAPTMVVDTVTPLAGGPGTEVTLSGPGVDTALQVLFGTAEAVIVRAADGALTVSVPEGSVTGPIELRGRAGEIVTTSERFLLPPEIEAVVPASVLAGARLQVAGRNLPTDIQALEVTVLGTRADVVSATASLITVLVPDVSGDGILSVRVGEFEASIVIEVRREQALVDLVVAASGAVWATSDGSIPFGQLADPGGAMVQRRAREQLEDGESYGPVLVMQPPRPDRRSLRGVYPEITLPDGYLELRLEFGYPWATLKARPGQDAQVQVSFAHAASGATTTLLPRTSMLIDGTLERFVVDAQAAAGLSGSLTLEVFPGNEAPASVALVAGRLVAAT